MKNHYNQPRLSNATDRCPLMQDEASADAPYKPTMTNADHIRSMTDEELADILVKNGCPPGMNYITCGTAGTCLECWINLLKQPYKEES